MTDRINLELFGGFRATLGDGRPYRLPTRKSEGLFAYLALPAGQFYTRDSLAALLWGETEETQARQSLRQAVLSIRKMWGKSPQPILLTRGDSIALNPELVLVDAVELETALADGRREVLEEAVLLRKGS